MDDKPSDSIRACAYKWDIAGLEAGLQFGRSDRYYEEVMSCSIYGKHLVVNKTSESLLDVAKLLFKYNNTSLPVYLIYQLGIYGISHDSPPAYIAVFKYTLDTYPHSYNISIFESACMHGNYSVGALLLKYANQNALDIGLITTVHLRCASIPLMQLLIEKGAKSYGDACLHACRYSSAEAVTLLLTYYREFAPNTLQNVLHILIRAWDIPYLHIIDTMEFHYKIYIPTARLRAACRSLTDALLLKRNKHKFVVGTQKNIDKILHFYSLYMEIIRNTTSLLPEITRIVSLY